jgi:hypothetical protein
VEIPPGWSVLEGQRPGRGATRMRLRQPDGRPVEWSSWHHRRGLGLLDIRTRRPVEPNSRATRVRTRWIAGLFAIGSVCFAVGSMPAIASQLRDSAVGVFFLGSLFFTAAAYLQFHEASNAGPDIAGAQRTTRFARLRTESVGWWAAAIQLVGTVAFNVSTLAAVPDLSVPGEQALMWAPDAFGSACFLLASALALYEICPRVLCWTPASREWWVAAVNLAGSVAFGVSAVAARIVPTTGEPANIDRVNATTFVGAVLFLVGAVLLPAAVSGGRGTGSSGR